VAVDTVKNCTPDDGVCWTHSAWLQGEPQLFIYSHLRWPSPACQLCPLVGQMLGPLPLIAAVTLFIASTICFNSLTILVWFGLVLLDIILFFYKGCVQM